VRVSVRRAEDRKFERISGRVLLLPCTTLDVKEQKGKLIDWMGWDVISICGILHQ